MDYSDIQTIEHDVLVVGAGGAGIRAAIECAHKFEETIKHLIAEEKFME